MLQAGPLLSLSPSFNSYSSSVGNLAEIAARVVSELRRENSDSASMFLYVDDDHDEELDHPWQLRRDDHDRRFRLHEERISPSSEPSVKELNESGDDDGEFEFAFAGRESPSSPISADEIFLNGQIRPVYPIFGKPSLVFLEDSSTAKSSDGNDETAPRPEAVPAPRRRQPLRKLMVEEDWASCSSSEADELDGLPSGTYCVWAPENTGDRRKSKSTGTTSVSKRWKLRDLILRRSNSGGKFAEKGTAAAEPEAEEKKSSAAAPYNKKELLGFLGNVNGLSRNLHPF